jgi:hypothetical protein
LDFKRFAFPASGADVARAYVTSVRKELVLVVVTGDDVGRWKSVHDGSSLVFCVTVVVGYLREWLDAVGI